LTASEDWQEGWYRVCLRPAVVFLLLPASISFALVARRRPAYPPQQASLSGSDVQEDAFQQGLIALKENRLEVALEKLTAAERQRSADARIRNFRGIVLARLGRNGEAANEYREAIRLDARLEDAHRNLGFLEWTERHLENARAELQRALQLAPDDSFAHYYLGRVQLDAKLYAEAFQELERSGVPWPSDAEFLIQAATGYRELGRKEEARKTADRLVDMPLSNAQSVSAAGLLTSLHRNDAAIDLLQKLRARQPAGSAAWAQFDLALAYLLSGVHDKAASEAHNYLEAFRPAGADTAAVARGWSLIGIAKARMGEGDSAIDAFRRAAALDAGREEHWLNLTRELMDLSRYADAISATQAALAANPKSYALHLRLGATYLSSDRYAEAEQTFRELVRAGDPLPTSYIGLAQVLLRTGRAEDAVMELTAAGEKLGPNFLIAYFRGLALNRAAKPEQAATAFEEAVHLNPNSAEAHFGLGKTELALGRGTDATSELEQSLRLSPGNVQAQRLLTQAHRRTGDNKPQNADAATDTPLGPQEHLVDDDFLLPQWEMPSKSPQQ
jgi:tetratricopeptide (TPR) repeat protein